MGRYDWNKVTVAEALADSEVVTIVEGYRPGLSTSPDVTAVSNLTVAEALKLAERYAKPGEIKSALAELDDLSPTTD